MKLTLTHTHTHTHTHRGIAQVATAHMPSSTHGALPKKNKKIVEFHVGLCLDKKKILIETFHKVNIASFTSIRASRVKVSRGRANSVYSAARERRLSLHDMPA